MFDTIRNHKKYLMGFLLILIIPSFVLFGIQGFTSFNERGETVASVMMRQANPSCRHTPVHGSSRAPFCMMGVCFDCLAIVDGASSTQTCLVPVAEGMCVERQLGRPKVAS